MLGLFTMFRGQLATLWNSFKLWLSFVFGLKAIVTPEEMYWFYELVPNIIKSLSETDLEGIRCVVQRHVDEHPTDPAYKLVLKKVKHELYHRADTDSAYLKDANQIQEVEHARPIGFEDILNISDEDVSDPPTILRNLPAKL